MSNRRQIGLISSAVGSLLSCSLVEGAAAVERDRRIASHSATATSKRPSAPVACGLNDVHTSATTPKALCIVERLERVIACEECKTVLWHLGWSRWGASSVVGRGVIQINEWRPNSAADVVKRFTLSVWLLSPKPAPVGRPFSRVDVHYRGAVTQRNASPPISAYSFWATSATRAGA